MKRSFRNEARSYIAAQIKSMGWISLIYPLGIFLVTDFSTRIPAFFFTAVFIQFCGVVGLSLLSKQFSKLEDDQLKSWDMKVFIARSMISLSMSAVVIVNFSHNGAIHWGSLFSVALWAVSTEVMLQGFHPMPMFAISQIFLVGGAPITYLISQGKEASAVGYVGLIYLFSAGVKLRNYHRNFVQNIYIKFKYQDEHSRHQEFIDIMPARVAWLDKNFNYIMVNNSMAEAFGKKKESYIGQKMGFAEANMADSMRLLLNNFIQSPESDLYFQAEFPIFGKAARWHQIHVRKLVRNGELNLIFVLLDIDDTRHMEKELEMEKARNIQSARLVSLGEMAAGIAHEIRNPLAIIHGNAEILRMDLSKPQIDKEKIGGRISKIEEMTERITKIIESMRKLSRDASHEDLSWSDLDVVLMDPVDLTSAKLKLASIHVETKFDEDIELLCQPQQVGQVILNLINNAYDIIKNIEGDRKLKVYTSPGHDGWLEVVVADNGPGAKDPSKLFTPFYTTKDAGEGTGIGLSLSKKILESHSGTLIYRRNGLWTEFVLRFPSESVRKKAASQEAA